MGSFVVEMSLLYAIALIGFVARRKQIFDSHATNAFTSLILYVTLPSLIIVSLDLDFSWTIVYDFFILVSLSFYAMNIAIILSVLMRKYASLTTAQRSAYEGVTIFGNQGFIGYAVIYLLFQEKGVVYLTIFNLYYLIVIWTYGIYLFTKRNENIDWKKIFLNPGIVSTFIGIVLLCSPFSLPSSLAATLENIGTMTVPLSMIMIGSFIADIRASTFLVYLKSKYLWLSAFVKLIAIPLLILPVAVFSLPFSLFATALIASGMPSAPTVAFYAYRFGADHSFAAIGVALTTGLCMMTIPFLYFLVDYVYR